MRLDNLTIFFLRGPLYHSKVLISRKQFATPNKDPIYAANTQLLLNVKEGPTSIL